MQLQYVMSTTREGNKRDNIKSRLMSITTMTRLTSSKRAWMPWSGYTCIWERERERERERSNRESVCVCVCGKHWEHHNCPMKEKSCVIQQHVGHFKEVCDSANLSLTPYTTTGVSHTHTHTHAHTGTHAHTHTLLPHGLQRYEQEQKMDTDLLGGSTDIECHYSWHWTHRHWDPECKLMLRWKCSV